MSTKVAIVFPVHNRRDITLICLQSLERLVTDNLAVSIYVVDDGSTDGTAEAIQERFPDVNLISGDGSLWFTEGTNVGVREALKDEPDYILMINDDAVFDSKFLVNMVETAVLNRRSVVGSLLLLWDTPHKLFQVSPRWETWSGGWRHWYGQTIWTVPDRPWEVDLIVGNCVLIPVEAIREHGLMDSERFPNFGDAEYTPRLRKNGWKLLIDPRARVFCQPNDLPVRIRSLSLGEMIRALVFDLKHSHNLRRRFYACIVGAPTLPQGLAAFVIFMLRILLRQNAEEAAAKGEDEPPLSETFSDAVIEGRIVGAVDRQTS